MLTSSQTRLETPVTMKYRTMTALLLLMTTMMMMMMTMMMMMMMMTHVIVLHVNSVHKMLHRLWQALKHLGFGQTCCLLDACNKSPLKMMTLTTQAELTNTCALTR